jgi:hypothetical protein
VQKSSCYARWSRCRSGLARLGVIGRASDPRLQLVAAMTGSMRFWQQWL